MSSAEPLPEARPLVLLVEDEDGVRRSLQLLLTGNGYQVRAYSAAAPVLADPLSRDATVLITDYRLPDSDGVRLLTALREKGWPGRAVLVTAFPSPELDRSARSAGFQSIIEKPLRHQQFLNALASAPD